MGALIISACYFGPVELYRAMAKADRVIVDLGEHYAKQSYRTRSAIASANGAVDLSVHIERTHTKTAMSDMHMSYAENWSSEHWHAIRSAYGQSAWFIHYQDEVRDAVLDKRTSLAERNVNTMQLMLKLCGLQVKLELSTEYLELENATDLRDTLHPKREVPEWLLPVPEYRQVFVGKHGFIPRLSILDLLMNLGPKAQAHLCS